MNTVSYKAADIMAALFSAGFHFTPVQAGELSERRAPR